MMIRRITAYTLWSLAGLCLLGACSSDDTVSQQTGQSLPELPIQFVSAGISAEAKTRSDASDTYNNSLPQNSEIGVYIYDSDDKDLSVSQPVESSPSTTWVYQVSGSTDTDGYAPLRLTSHTKNPKFPLKEASSNYKDHVKVFAVFPNNKDFMPSDSRISYDFTVSQQQIEDADIIASDLLASDQKQYSSDDCKQRLDIHLKHRMAKVQVIFTPKEGSDLTTANMPTNFDVVNIQRTVSIKPTTGDITTSTATSDKTTEDSPLKGITSQSFFIPPQTIQAGTTLLRFNILPTYNFKGINGATFAPKTDAKFDAGKVYQIKVTVDIDFATLTGSIGEWNTETMTFTPIIL